MSISDDETLLEDNPGSPQNDRLTAGTMLGDYRIVRPLGAGAMGEVYLARQVHLNQTYALKLLPKALTQSPDFEKRFEIEGQSLAMLDHQNIVRVYNASIANGRHFLAMEYVGGGSLEDRIDKNGGALPAASVRKCLAEILSGLAFAHEKNIVHRDLKPANILCTVDGQCKIGDFGLALVADNKFYKSIVDEQVRKSRLAGYDASASKTPRNRTKANLDDADTIVENPAQTDGRNASRQNLDDADTIVEQPAPRKSSKSIDDAETLLENNVRASASMRSADSNDAGAFVGTLDYMSPEIRDGRGLADARSDVYAVGVIAYQMLTARKPRGHFDSPSKIVRGLSPKWDEWVFKCMKPEPKDRFQSAREALAALPKKSGKTHIRPIAIGVAAAALAIPAIVFWSNKGSEVINEKPSPTHSEQSVRTETPKTEPQAISATNAVAPAENAPVKPDSAAPQTKAFSSEKNFTVTGCKIDMVWIEPGTFTMGSPDAEPGHQSDEKQHKVTLTKGFWLGKYEVTQSQWQTVMGNNPSNFKDAGGDLPVECVRWKDAMEFCRMLTGRERAAGRLPVGYEYSLPTEAQWEYACRAGTDTMFGFGNDEGNLFQFGNYCDSSNTDNLENKDVSHNDGYDKTSPVGSYKPNAWGLYDMHGNVCEWCYDRYAASSRGNNVSDPKGPETGTHRVSRGGGWNYDATFCRSAVRLDRDPNYSFSCVGFRLALRAYP